MRHAWIGALLLAGCMAPIPVVDPVDPRPGPVNPGPVDPGPTPPSNGEGTITLAAYDSIPDGASETEVYGQLGKPFRRSETGGYVVLVYALRDSDSVAWFFLKDGNLDHKRRL